MKRASQIVMGIVLGALAAGAGIGVFLYKANVDRTALGEQLVALQQQAERARAENHAAILEANRKLQDASTEVAKAQSVIEALEEERVLIAEAVQLSAPTGRIIRGWAEVVSLEFGLALKIPSGSTVTQNTSRQLSTDWLSIIPYTKEKEAEWSKQLSSTTTVSYLVEDRLLTGAQGATSDEAGPNFVLRIQKKGVPSHLVWIRDPDGRTGPSNRVRDILSTMTFDSM